MAQGCWWRSRCQQPRRRGFRAGTCGAWVEGGAMRRGGVLTEARSDDARSDQARLSRPHEMQRGGEGPPSALLITPLTTSSVHAAIQTPQSEPCRPETPRSDCF